MPRVRDQPADGSVTATSEKWPAKGPKPNGGGGIFCKTKMCRFNILGICSKGGECPYAHSREELKPTPDLYRTKVCKNLISTGRCEDPECRYAHSKDQLRTTSLLKKGAKSNAVGQAPPGRGGRGGAAKQARHHRPPADVDWDGPAEGQQPLQVQLMAKFAEPEVQEQIPRAGEVPQPRHALPPLAGGAQEQRMDWQQMKQLIPMASSLPAADGHGAYTVLLQQAPFCNGDGGINATGGGLGAACFQGSLDHYGPHVPCLVDGGAHESPKPGLGTGLDEGRGGGRGTAKNAARGKAATWDATHVQEVEPSLPWASPPTWATLKEEDPTLPPASQTPWDMVKSMHAKESEAFGPRAKQFLAMESLVDPLAQFTVKNTFLDFGSQPTYGFDASDAQFFHASVGLLFAPAVRG